MMHGTLMNGVIAEIAALWRELVEAGFELNDASLGIWDGPRIYELHFLSLGKVMETKLIEIATARDFEALRAELKEMVQRKSA